MDAQSNPGKDLGECDNGSIIRVLQSKSILVLHTFHTFDLYSHENWAFSTIGWTFSLINPVRNR